MKPIRLSNHAIDYINIRGFTESEMIEAIRNGKWASAKKNRIESKLGFPFQKEWNGKYYNTKEVKPVFVEEEYEIIVITVYTYYT